MREMSIATGGQQLIATGESVRQRSPSTDLIARLRQRRPASHSPSKPATTPESEEVEREQGCMAVLCEELRQAVVDMEAAHYARVSASIVDPKERPPPVLLPMEHSTSEILPRSREKSSSPRTDLQFVRVVHDSDYESEESDDSDDSVGPGRQAPNADKDEEVKPTLHVAYALTPEGFAIYVDTPLRKQLDENEEEVDESEEEDDEEEDDSEDETPQRRVLGELNMNNFIEV